METQSREEVPTKIDNSANSIPRVDISSLTPEIFFERYRKTATPAVITGLLDAEDDWTLDYLCEKLGNHTFLFRNAEQGRDTQDKRKRKSIGSGNPLQSMSFTEYAQLIGNHQAHEQDINLGKCSLKTTPLAGTHSLERVGEQLGLNKPMSDLNLYVAPGGHHSGLHYDSVDGTLMQLHGSKRILLFPPSQTYNLHPFPVFIHLRHGLKLRCWFSQVEPENPDFESFPRFQEALRHQRDLILNRGEVLFIPAGWWHDVTSLGDEMVCAVNRFWRVYPTSRVLFSWSRWRAVLGNLCAVPYLLGNVVTTLFNSDREQGLGKLLHRF